MILAGLNMITFVKRDHMTYVKLKPRKSSLVDLTSKYANDEDACREFFIKVFYPDGWGCNKCGCHHCHPVA